MKWSENASFKMIKWPLIKVNFMSRRDICPGVRCHNVAFQYQLIKVSPRTSAYLLSPPPHFLPIHTGTYMHVHTTHMHTNRHTCKHTAYTHTGMHTCTHEYTGIHKHMYTQTHSYMGTHVYKSTDSHPHVHICRCMNTCYTGVYMYAQTHSHR